MLAYEFKTISSAWVILSWQPACAQLEVIIGKISLTKYTVSGLQLVPLFVESTGVLLIKSPSLILGWCSQAAKTKITIKKETQLTFSSNIYLANLNT